jgi:hypothetical protein
MRTNCYGHIYAMSSPTLGQIGNLHVMIFLKYFSNILSSYFNFIISYYYF